MPRCLFVCLSVPEFSHGILRQIHLVSSHVVLESNR